MNGHVIFDGRGLAFAILVAAAYLVLGSSWPLAIGAGVLVYAVKVALELRSWQRPPRMPAPVAGSVEAVWLERGDRAIASIEQLRRSARSEAVSQRFAAISAQAQLTLAGLRRLAYQAGVVSALTRPAEADELRAAEQRMQKQLEAASGPLRGELERTLASIVARREAAERLEAARHELHARIESSALGLEGVVARLAEIVAITDGAPRGTPVDELVSELDTLRTAMVEAETFGRTSVLALTRTIDEGR